MVYRPPIPVESEQVPGNRSMGKDTKLNLVYPHFAGDVIHSLGAPLLWFEKITLSGGLFISPNPLLSMIDVIKSAKNKNSDLEITLNLCAYHLELSRKKIGEISPITNELGDRCGVAVFVAPGGKYTYS